MRARPYQWLMLFAAVCLSAPAATKAATEINARDFGLHENVDASLPLRRALEACRLQEARRLVIPPGRYRLSPAFAAEYYCTPSNGDRGLAAVAFLVKDFNGLTIEATGVEFIFRQPMIPFAFIGCRDVTLRGCTIDWDRLLAFQGTVLATDATANSFDLAVHPDCVTTIRDGILQHGEDPEESTHTWPLTQDLTWSRWFDPVIDTWIQGNPYSGQYAYRAWNPKKQVFARVEPLGEGRYRLYDAVELLPRVGWTLFAKGMRTPNRRSPAIWITESTNTRLEDVTLHHAGGMGVIAEQSRDVLLRRVRIEPKPGSGRVISTSADATHFSACAGLIEFDECFFDRMLDDGANIHGIHLLVESRPDDRRIVGRIGHFQQAGHRFAVPGDRILFLDAATLRTVSTAEVAGVERLNTHRLLLTFKQPLPALPDGCLMDNASWTPDVHMHGCTIRSNMARSLLINTPGRVVIEDNHFINPSEYNIGGGPSPGFWFESGSLQNLTIRRNEFVVAHRDAPAISLGGGFPHLSAGYNRNFTIEDNLIHTRGGVFLQLKGVEQATFRRNRIITVSGEKNDTGVRLINCGKIEISGNRIEGDCAYRVQTEGDAADIRVDNGPALTLAR